ncbi:histidine phosphatase family protein [Shewanella sp. JM162201]|uniref:Histidine phosphatase family protein n=1 Tax=Shewanella jiangmenensis TaxID=2837387 RepID=A0ABS5V3J0_9GAMM|nr:histidine phosphatase family protein [Shewanella jiangmenensis]MBT1444386.1 histidine phosphatase family protein [Shewanella jiangmenensis]
MESCEIVFWRHGECLDGGVLRGRTDSAPDLTSLDAIVRYAAALANPSANASEKTSANASAKPSAIVSSPLSRCLVLGQALANQAGCPLSVDNGFAEMDFGDWDGRSLAELWQEAPLEAWWQNPWEISPPNGETMAAFEARVEKALNTLLNEHKPGERIWVVTHGGVIRALMAYILGARRQSGFYNRLDIPYGACVGSRWYRSGDGWQGQLVWQNMALPA